MFWMGSSTTSELLHSCLVRRAFAPTLAPSADTEVLAMLRSLLTIMFVFALLWVVPAAGEDCAARSGRFVTDFSAQLLEFFDNRWNTHPANGD